MVVSSLQSIQDEFFIDSVECVHQGFEHEMDMSRQYDGSFWQEWKIKFIKLFVEKCTPHGLKSGIIDMMGNVQKKFQTNTLLLSKLSCLYVLEYASLQHFYLTLNFHCKMISKSCNKIWLLSHFNPGTLVRLLSKASRRRNQCSNFLVFKFLPFLKMVYMVCP